MSADGNAQQSSFTRMKVPVAPSNVGSGGKASLQPKRTPVSNEEIEAILVCKMRIPTFTALVSLLFFHLYLCYQKSPLSFC